MIFDLTREQVDAFNEALMAETKEIVAAMQSGAIAPGDSRAIEARMRNLCAGRPELPEAEPVAFAYGRHVRSVIVWRKRPPDSQLTQSDCDRFLGTVQAPPPHPVGSYVEFWHCTRAQTVTSFCAGKFHDAPLVQVLESMEQARTIEAFLELPLDMCVAAALAVRLHGN